MYKNIIASSGLHFGIIILATLSWPFLAKKPIDLPPLISVELIQITDQTNIPYAPKAKKIIEKVKKEQKKLMSGQAPPKKIKKEKPKEVTKLDEKKKIVVENPKAVPKPDKNKEKIKELKEEAIPLPDKKTEVLKSKKETKQNPSKDKRLQKKVKKIQENQKPNIEDTKVKQVSEFEKKEIFDPTNIAALIDKSKEETGETTKKTNKITQFQDINMEFSRLTLSEEDALNMVTINPAKLLHIDHRVGSIKEGKDADIVIWSDHPLSIYSKVEKTYIDGRLYFDIVTHGYLLFYGMLYSMLILRDKTMKIIMSGFFLSAVFLSTSKTYIYLTLLAIIYTQFFKGIKNPISVSVAGYSPSQISVICTNGSISTVNKKAGKDLYNGSFILRCIPIDPNNKTDNPKLPINDSAVNCIEANKIIAKLTFKNPII